MKIKNQTQVVVALVLIAALGIAYQQGLFAGNGYFMVEVKTPSGVAPGATCFLMKDGKQIQSQKVGIVTSGKPGCKFYAPATIYDLVVQCDNSPIHEDRQDIEIFPPASIGEQTVCWGTFYPVSWGCQQSRGITIACTADACDTVVGQNCKGNEVWNICHNGILKEYVSTCSANCVQKTLVKSGTSVVSATVACEGSPDNSNTSIGDQYVHACISGTCRQVLKATAGSYTPCNGLGTGCGTSPSTTLQENTCSFDFQCGVGGATGDTYCSGGNLLRDNIVKSCVSGYCQTSRTANVVKDCKGWGCDDETGACKQDQTVDTGCKSNSDCGTSGNIGTPTCSGNTVVQNYRAYTCSSGTCSSSVTANTIKTCTGSCTNGQCAGVDVTTTTSIPGQTTTTTLCTGSNCGGGGFTTSELIIIVVVILSIFAAILLMRK